MITREIREEDWRSIAWLASSEAQEGDHDSIDFDWIERRRDRSRARFDAVIEAAGEIVSYCALERDTANDDYRVFVVLDWGADDGTIAEATFAEIENLISNHKIRRVWMREMEDDRSLIEFVQQKGFVIDKRYEYDGFRLVNLSKSYET